MDIQDSALLQAIDAWAEAEPDSEADEQAFTHMLELAQTKEDFELIIKGYCDPESILSARKDIRRIFDKADAVLGKD